MMDLFYTYLRLYPGKADVIRKAMADGEKEVQAQGLAGKEAQDLTEAYILDALD